VNGPGGHRHDLAAALRPCVLRGRLALFAAVRELGLCPEFGSSLLLPMAAGYHRAAKSCCWGEPASAEEALEMGWSIGSCRRPEVLGHAQAGAPGWPVAAGGAARDQATAERGLAQRNERAIRSERASRSDACSKREGVRPSAPFWIGARPIFRSFTETLRCRCDPTSRSSSCSKRCRSACGAAGIAGDRRRRRRAADAPADRAAAARSRTDICTPPA